MNFNTDPQLFVNLRATILATDPPLRTGLFLKDGHIIFRGDVIARFTNDYDALAVLSTTGFVADNSDGFTTYRATL